MQSPAFLALAIALGVLVSPFLATAAPIDADAETAALAPPRYQTWPQFAFKAYHAADCQGQTEEFGAHDADIRTSFEGPVQYANAPVCKKWAKSSKYKSFKIENVSGDWTCEVQLMSKKGCKGYWVENIQVEEGKCYTHEKEGKSLRMMCHLVKDGGW